MCYLQIVIIIIIIIIINTIIKCGHRTVYTAGYVTAKSKQYFFQCKVANIKT